MTLMEKLEKYQAAKSLYELRMKELAEAKKTLEDADESQLEAVQKALEDVDAKTKTAKETMDTLKKEIDEEEEKLKTLAGDAAKKKESNKFMNNYLATKQALSDFANVLLAHPEDKAGVQKAWEENLTNKGITNPDVLLPEPVANAITDAFKKSGSIFATLKHTGMTAYKVVRNTVTDATGRAKGHKRGTTKQEQTITLADKILRAQYVYKYITLDKETLRENQDTNAIIRYILEELPQRVVMEVERAAIIGDGRDAGAEDKITALEAVVNAGASFTASATRTDASLLEDLVNLDAEVEAEGDRYLVMTRKTLAALKLAKDGNGNLMYPLGTDFAGVLGVKEIFTPDWFAEQTDFVAVEYIGDSYKLVGDNVIESYDNFILAKNKHEYLAELYIGGGLTELKSAGVLRAAAAV